MTRTRLGIALAALALVATACQGSTPQSGEGGGGGGQGGEIVFAIGGTEAAPGGTHTETVDLWNQTHPEGPRVRLERLPDAADEQRQQLALDLQSQSGNFDVVGLDVIWTGEFSTNGWLESFEDRRADLEPQIIAGALESAQWEGQLWAVPYNSNGALFYYRTDLVPQPPRTWDEAMQVGMEAAQRAGIAPYVGQGAQYEGMLVNYLEYFWGAGGELLNEDASQVLFGTNEAAMQALDFMRRAQETGFYAPGFNTMMEDQARLEFQSGRAVFMRNWPSFYSLMTGEDPANPSQVAGKFAVAPLPTFTGEGTTSALGGFNLGVSAFSDVKEQAKEFAMFAATNPEVQRNMAENTLPPVLTSVYDEVRNDPVMGTLAQILPDARPRPPAPEWNAISETMQEEVFAAYNGEKPPDQAITAIRSFLEREVVGGS
jgi:multiple sugar transport system substrate-binding protein